MALVPNGRFRLMFAQQMGQNDPNNHGVGAGASPAGTPSPRNDVQQEAVGAGASPAAAPAQDQNAGGMPSEMAQVPEMATTEEGGTASSPDATNPDDQTRDAATTLKAYVYKVLEAVGVEPRQLESVDKHIFSQEIDFDTHTIQGHYMIPTFTRGGEVDEKKAMQVAQKIGQQFGLSQKMKLEGRNWRVTFRSMPKTDIQNGGSSFDELGGAAGGGKANLQKGNSGMRQASFGFTMGEMLKARHDDLIETMRKIAKGK